MSHPTQYKRPLFEAVVRRLREPRRFLQVLYGPRQSGKTTLIRQVLESLNIPTHYASADEPGLRPLGWITEQWELGRLKIRKGGEVVVVLDEIQKVPGWSETVKRLWDEDSARGSGLKVVVLGSAPLMMQRGLSESLAGRFEVLAVPHWSYPEMRDAFGWDLERFIYFGGYPGSAALIDDEHRWARYVVDSLIETTISRDVFHMARVDKPALLRRLFQLGCEYSGQVLSYQKMLGQLQESSNTTTLAHYLDLLSGAGMIAGIPKFAGQKVRQRGSSPKLMVLNTALMSALSHFGFEEARRERSFWGRIVESSVGAHLLGSAMAGDCEVFYWRERGREVDFVLKRGRALAAVEVKSGRPRDAFPGMEEFRKSFNPARILVVGERGISLEDFLTTPIADWIDL